MLARTCCRVGVDAGRARTQTPGCAAMLCGTMCGMLGLRIDLLAAGLITTVTFLGATMENAQAEANSSARFAVKLRAQRTSPLDLEVGGDLLGLPAGTTRYLTRDDLLALPQVMFKVTDDPNFTGPTQVKGILLEELAHDLGAAPPADLVVATCDDKYRANYPPEYLTQHHPVLVLEVNGKPPSGWPKDSSRHEFDMGPYMISHAKFTPAFKILSHNDESQIPWGVVRLEFRNGKVVFGAIAPRGPRPDEGLVQAGYKIAQQNCFRCHNLSASDEQKSWAPWEVLSAIAAGSPEWFAAYVRNPKSKNPQAQMPGNPQYDDETMKALITYFRTFSHSEKP